MKLGIISSGMIVGDFLPGIVSIDGIDVKSIFVTTRSLEKGRELFKKNNIDGFVTDDFVAFCSSGIDTVYVASPNHTHFDYCAKCLENGMNVIVEKPMTSNYDEAVALQNIMLEKKLFVFEAITNIYLDVYKKIQNWLPKIGEVKLVQAQYSQYSSRYDRFLAGEYFPVFDPKKSGGTLMDLNVYNLHFVMGLFGEPKSTKYFARLEKGIDLSGIVLLDYGNFMASCIASKDCYDAYGAMIQGLDGIIRANGKLNSLGDVSLELRDGTKEKVEGVQDKTRHLDEFKTFLDAINRNDFAFCEERMKHSVSVCKVLTDARNSAGIKFPADLVST